MQFYGSLSVATYLLPYFLRGESVRPRESNHERRGLIRDRVLPTLAGPFGLASALAMTFANGLSHAHCFRDPGLPTAAFSGDLLRALVMRCTSCQRIDTSFAKCRRTHKDSRNGE